MSLIRVDAQQLINHCFLKVTYNQPDAPGAIHTAPGEVKAVTYIGVANEDIPKAFTDKTGIPWNDSCSVDRSQLFHADGEPITEEDLKMFADIGSFVELQPDMVDFLKLKNLSLSEEGIHKSFFREFPTVTMVGTAATAPSAPCPCGSGSKFKKCCQFK